MMWVLPHTYSSLTLTTQLSNFDNIQLYFTSPHSALAYVFSSVYGDLICGALWSRFTWWFSIAGYINKVNERVNLSAVCVRWRNKEQTVSRFWFNPASGSWGRSVARARCVTHTLKRWAEDISPKSHLEHRFTSWIYIAEGVIVARNGRRMEVGERHAPWFPKSGFMTGSFSEVYLLWLQSHGEAQRTVIFSFLLDVKVLR